MLGIRLVAHNLPLEVRGTRNSRQIKYKGPSSERHLAPRDSLMCPVAPSSIFCVHPQNLPPSLIPPSPALLSPTPEVKQTCRCVLCSRAFWMLQVVRRIVAREPLCVILFGSVTRASMLWSLWLLLIPVYSALLLGSSETLVYDHTSTTIYVHFV